MRYLALIIVLSVMFPSAAHASFWLECRVNAILQETAEEGVYDAQIHGGIVTDGHATRGEACMSDDIGKILQISLDGAVVTGRDIALKYEFFNSDGPDGGVTNIENWSVWK